MAIKIAIIGAGLSGLTLARKLDAHADVTVFEKSHSVGGRMSTRTEGDYSFDHGAQYFSVKSEEFQTFLTPYVEGGIVSEWHPNIVQIEKDGSVNPINWSRPRFVASPRMRSLCEALSDGLNVKLQQRITDVKRTEEANWINTQDDKSIGPFDWIISTVPSHQAIEILPKDSSLQSSLTNIQMRGCYALMLGFKAKFEMPWDAMIRPELSEDQAVSWIAVNSTKAGRQDGFSLLVQSSNLWANDHLDYDQDEIKNVLLKDLEKLLGMTLPDREYEELHKWRYANVATPANMDFLMDEKLKLAACGDWCRHGKVEAAFLSASSLAKDLISNRF